MNLRSGIGKHSLTQGKEKEKEQAKKKKYQKGKEENHLEKN